MFGVTLYERMLFLVQWFFEGDERLRELEANGWCKMSQDEFLCLSTIASSLYEDLDPSENTDLEFPIKAVSPRSYQTRHDGADRRGSLLFSHNEKLLVFDTEEGALYWGCQVWLDDNSFHDLQPL